MTQKDLTEGLKFQNVTGTIPCLAIIYKNGKFRNYDWVDLKIENAELEVLKPKKRFHNSGTYPWIRLNSFDTAECVARYNPNLAIEEDLTGTEYLIPWGDIKPLIK